MSSLEETSAGTRYPKLRVMYWVASAMLLGVFLAAGSARLVSPEHLWALQLIAPATPLLSVCVLVLLSVSALLRHWGLVLVGGLCWLSVMLGPALKNQTPASRSPEVLGLVVVSFNANTGHAGAKNREMQALLEAVKPHVVALQEVPVQFVPETGGVLSVPLVQPLLAERAYEPAWPETSGRAQLRQPIFGRIPTRGHLEHILGYEDGELWESGMVDRVVYQWEGQAVALYNVHLHSFSGNRPWRDDSEETVLSLTAWRKALRSYRKDFRIRARQAQALKRLLDAEPLPFIVCGDLNSTPYSWVYRHVSRGLTDAFAEVGRGWGMTFPSRRPLVRIDYVFASSQWEIRQAFRTRIVYSDHLPVVAELALRSPRSSSE